MYCDSPTTNWNRPSIQIKDSRALYGDNEKFFDIESSAATLIFRAAQAKWQVLASPFKPSSTPKPQINTKAISLLDDWLLEDEGDQKETWTSLTKALDENRLSHRRLFS